MDSVTLALTGHLPFVILAAAITALPVSLLLLSLYRRRVLVHMARRVRGQVPSPAVAANGARGETVCEVVELGTEQPAGALTRSVRASECRLRYVYAAAGAAFALTMTVAVLLAGEMSFGPLRVLLLFWVYAWPVALTINLVTPATRRSSRAAVGGYFLGLALLGAMGVMRSEDLSLAQVVTLWTITNLPPTVLIQAALVRRIRAVGPMVLAVMLLCFLGAILAIALVGSQDSLLRAVVDVASRSGMGAGLTFAVILVLGFTLFAGVGWMAIKWLGRAYVAKRINDRSLTMDALWLLFAVVQSIGLAFAGVWWTLAGLVAFLVYKTVVHLGFRWARVELVPVPRCLLVLRVFSLGSRSEKLFDVIAGRWRYLGHVALIAGPDLAATTVQPHGFLEFLAGRLSALFVDGESALKSRLANLDRDPDVDGRYRVNDFFCHEDTWEMVLARLVADSDAVLMDLRAFSRANAGCVREIRELLNVVDMAQVVLVVDRTTDRIFLEQTLADAVHSMSPASPNRQGSSVRARVFELADPDSSDAMALLGHLATASDHGVG